MGAMALLLLCISSMFLSSHCARVYSAPLQDLGALVPNGNFEISPHPSELNKTVIMGRHSLSDWTIQGHVEYVSGGIVVVDRYLAVPHGDHAVRLGNKASISTNISNLKAGSLYSLTFSASRTCPLDEALRVSVPPLIPGDIPLQPAYSITGEDTYAWGFYATEPTVEVIFHNPGGVEDPACGPLLDAVAIKELTPPRPTRFDLVKNGGFEEGPQVFKNATAGILLPPMREDAVSPLPGWIIQSPKAVRFVDKAHFSVPAGLYAVELVAGRESAIAQVIRTVPNKAYNLGFDIGDAKNNCHGTMFVEVYAGNQTETVPFESAGKGESISTSWQFTATGARTRITFFSSYYHLKADNSGSLCGPVLDQVSVAPIA